MTGHPDDVGGVGGRRQYNDGRNRPNEWDGYTIGEMFAPRPNSEHGRFLERARNRGDSGVKRYCCADGCNVALSIYNDHEACALHTQYCVCEACETEARQLAKWAEDDASYERAQRERERVAKEAASNAPPTRTNEDSQAAVEREAS